MSAHRPALAPVLAAVTRPDADLWRHAAPAEALEALAAAGLVPAHWTDAARAPRWWCEACEGEGQQDGACNCPDCDPLPCDACDETGEAPAPPSHAALVAVAALGAAELARAEALVAETWPGRALAWRVTTAEEIRRHHVKHCAGESASPALVFSREMTPPVANFEWRPAWPEACPYSGMFGTPDDDRHGVHRAWPALRALAVAEDGTPTGLHLVALDAGRVTLAVEALA